MRRPSFRPRLLPALSVLLVPLCATATSDPSANRTATPITAPIAAPIAAPTPTMCGNEPVPAIEPMYTLVCALDKGVSPDTGRDQGDAIRAALESLISSESGLYFPQGQYVVRGSLPLRTGNVLVGSRSGVTHFVNDEPATTAITHTFHSAKKILVEGLVLDNIAIQFLHAGTSVARYNGLRGTRSANPQISTIGADQIVGNVLWREAAFPGVGISAPLGTGASIEGNLLGADDPRVTVSGPISGLKKDVQIRTRRLIKQMSLLTAPIGAGAVASQGRGHFTEALRVGRTTDTRILRNDIAVNSVSASLSGPLQWAARVRDSQGLTLAANRFTTVGAAGTADAVLELVAPQNSRVAWNRMDRVPLLLSPDSSSQRATKQTVVNKNELTNAVIHVAQPVTGDDAASTTINDLRFLYNHFVTADPTQCLIDAPIPSQPGRTFGEAGNTRNPGGEPAKTCNLRPWVPPSDRVRPLPIDPPPAPPPLVPGGEVSPDPSNRTGVEGPEGISRRDPPVTSPTPDEPRKPWHKRMGERLKKAWKKVF